MRKYSKIVCTIFILLLLFNLSGCKNKQQNKTSKKASKQVKKQKVTKRNYLKIRKR